MTPNTNFMSEGIAFTQYNSNAPLNKMFDKDGKKTSRANMYSGAFQTKTAHTISELFSIFDSLLPNQAIGLGVSKSKEAGSITTSAKVTETAIARTKEFFSFGSKAYLLVDYDPNENGYVVQSPAHLVELLRRIDPLLENVEIGVRYGSSYGVCKDDVLISKKESMHAYFVIENANDELVLSYKEYLTASAWLNGYGHIELSKIGSVMKRQFFDATVFSPERLIFEAEPTLEQGITRVVPEAYIAEGSSYRDLTNIPTPPIEGEQIFLEEKAKHTGQAQHLKSKYIDCEVRKQVLQGANESDAKRIVNSRVNDKVLLPEDTLLTKDNIQIKVSDIIKNPTKYDKLYIHDPLEPDKGASKAIINAKDANSIAIYSYLHGGSTYSVKPDFCSIVDLVDNSRDNGAKENRTLIEQIENLCSQADLQDTDRKEVAKMLKKKKIATSINALESKNKDVTNDNTPIQYPNTIKGNPLMTMDNLAALINYYGVQVSYDVILKKTNMSFPFQMWNTDDMINTQIAHIKNLCVQNGLSIATEKHYLGALIDQNSVNPLLNMLNAKWDGIDRITQVLNTISSPDELLYKSRVFIKWLIQCVAAWDGIINCPIENAKIRFENVLVFVGGQGVRKTQFFEDLLPKQFRDYVATGIHLDPSDKDSIMLAISAGITELGELDSTFAKDIARLKAFLSLKTDKFRRPYDRVEREFQRRTSFCASVNDDEFLVDPTGNRRFIPLKVESIDYKTYESIDKVQLWAQVNEQFYLQSYHWWIDEEKDPEIVEILNKKHIEHFVMSSADEIAAVVIETTRNAPESTKFWKTSTEIAIAYKLPVNGRKNFTIIKKALEKTEIAFNSKTKQFKVMYHV